MNKLNMAEPGFSSREMLNHISDEGFAAIREMEEYGQTNHDAFCDAVYEICQKYNIIIPDDLIVLGLFIAPETDAKLKAHLQPEVYVSLTATPGSFSVTPNGVPLMIISSEILEDPDKLAVVLIHELVHYSQWKAGRLEFIPAERKVVWDGVIYDISLSTDLQGELEKPWEPEAYKAAVAAMRQYNMPAIHSEKAKENMAMVDQLP